MGISHWHSYDDRSNYRRQDHPYSPIFQQQKIQDQIHPAVVRCLGTVSVPDPGGILAGIEQLVELVDKIITHRQITICPAKCLLSRSQSFIKGQNTAGSR